jgi:rubredoxin
MFKMIFVVAIAAIIALFQGSANAFQANPRTTSLATRPSSVSTSSTLFFFGQPKDDGKPGDYLCKDCGYVFTKGPEAWAKEPEKGTCPPCGAPKFRFKKVPKGSANGKVEVKKSWF